MKYMYSPTYIASITKCCFVFAFPYAFYRVTKRVKDATDNNQENVIRNCGMWVISPDFMDSDYCYSKEMQRALERHHRKEARVIPVILRPIDWQDILGDIQALPTDAQPVLSPLWHSPEEAFYDVAQGIRKVVMQLTPRTLTGHTDEVYSVALSADGQTLASGSSDKTIKVWNLSTGQAVRTLTDHTDAVISVAISADGQTLVSGSSDTTVKVRGV
jgi:hypothetical protein